MSFLTTVHVPVLIQPILEFVAALQPHYVLDGTLGGGGHTLAIANQMPEDGRLVACDRDPKAVEVFQARLKAADSPLAGKVAPLHASYHEIADALGQLTFEVPGFDLILLDLGLSSDQLADDARGFSFRASGELDLRFDPTQGEPAWQVLQEADEKLIADILYQLGEERFSRRIAAAVIRTRKTQPIRTAEQFRELILANVPGSRHGRIDPATRSFQAMRIYVNEELQILTRALADLPKLLRVDGQFHVISFHSLEDRLVKNAFRDALDLEVVTRKPIIADETEQSSNPRSRSAKLRIARKLPPDRLKPPPSRSDADFRRHR